MLKQPGDLNLLLKQRNAHEDLAAAQVQSLLLRQKQLQILEGKLKTLEGQKFDDYPQESTIISKQKQLEQLERQLAFLEQSFNNEPAIVDQMQVGETITTEKYADNINSEFPTDLQVQRQTLEKLSYLEDQLAQLKELKAQMIEGAEIMEKRHSEVKTIHEITPGVEKDLKDQDDDIQNMANKSEEKLSRSELEVATDAMLSYLNMKEKQEEGETVDEEALLQQLMQRLMAASVDKNDLAKDSSPLMVDKGDEQHEENLEIRSDTGNESTKNEHEYERLLDEEEESEDGGPIKGEEAMSEILATSEKINLAINGLNNQIDQVKNSEELITTEKERLYFEDVLGKLQSQMAELVEIRTKINYYKELLDRNQEIRQLEDEMNEMQNTPETALFDADFSKLEVFPEVVVEAEQVEGTAVAAEALNGSNDPIPVAEKVNNEEEGPVVESQTAFEVIQHDYVESQECRVRAEKQNEVESAPTRSQFFSPRSASSMSFASGMIRKEPTARIKKLFGQNKESIYQSAATFITAYEARPHFLLSLFQKLIELAEDDVAHQELLLVLDEMIHVKNEEDAENDEVDTNEEQMLQRLNN